jgi:hypothetical protein
VNLPLVGQLVLLDEPYDDEARRSAVRATSGLPDLPGNPPAEPPVPP